MSTNAKRIFIVGVGRSGTSLLQSMIASHSKVVMMPETSFIRRYLISPILNIDDRNENLSKIKRDKYLQRWEKDNVVELSRLENDDYDSLRSFYDQVSIEYLTTKPNDNLYLAEKDPKLIEFLPHLDELFKDYKVIHIVRDPRDVFLSKSKAPWSKKQSIFKKLIANNAQLLIGNKYKKQNPNKIVEIKYEDLLRSPERVLKSLCSFLGVEYEENMLSFQQEARKLVSNDEMSWKKETIGPLLKSNTSKWKSEMEPALITLIQDSCRIAMKKGNYPFVNYKLSLIQKIKIFTISFSVIMASQLYAFKNNFFLKAKKQ